MIKNIIFDIVCGIANSLRIDKLAKIIVKDAKLANLYKKLIKYNFLMYLAPPIINILIINLSTLYLFLLPIVNLTSMFFHIISYIDLINAITKYHGTNAVSNDIVSMISQSIIMSFYHASMHLTIKIVDLFFGSTFYYLSLIINFLILTIYHSFYCYNNLWHLKKIEMVNRINIHEVRWPYYIGFGILPSIMYLFLYMPYMIGFYNLYISILITIPFLVEPYYPKKNMPYPSINLKFFSVVVKIVFSISKYITGAIL